MKILSAIRLLRGKKENNFLPSEIWQKKIVRPILTYADEAHHAVAPILKRVIQYYDTDFTVRLTATDQRPDKKKQWKKK